MRTLHQAITLALHPRALQLALLTNQTITLAG